MSTPSITVISSTHGTSHAIGSQLKELFKTLVKINTVVLSDHPKPHSIADQLVIITNKIIEQEALPYIKPGVKILVADCAVSIDTIDRLYDIPENSDVLLVNPQKETTLEALSQLMERGIHHLNFYPYYPGIESYRTDCPYVVTFGETQFVPPGFDAIIDLGSRPLDITTCIKISMEIGIYDNVKETISVAFMRPGIELSYSYSKQYRKNRVLTNNLQRILDRFTPCVVMLDENNSIMLQNPQAKKLLKIDQNSSPYMPSLLQKIAESESSFFYQIDGSSYYVESINDVSGEAGNTIIVINNVKNIEKIEKDYRAMLLKDGLVAQYSFQDIICESAVMKQLLQKSRQFAKSDSTVSIFGESGCGKELIAQAIHNASHRHDKAFVAVNFAALSQTLSEAELFGYVDGAFTGAKKGGQKGLFELAHNGTIFLDEIGDCSLDIQKKILRVIQERKVMPIGGNRLIPIDIRIITATNQNLYGLVKKKEFREDLYYRLNVLPLKIPALRARRDDILPLFLHFMNRSFHVDIAQLPPDLADRLLNHSWRGNVRELRNVAEYAANCMQSDADLAEALDDILIDIDAEEAPGVSTDSICQLVRQLETQCELNKLHRILKTIDAPPYLWSRTSLAEKINDTQLRESTIKRYLSILKDNDLIQSKTGEGSYIKQAGKELLRFFQQN